MITALALDEAARASDLIEACSKYPNFALEMLGQAYARFRATSGRSDFSIALIVGYGLRPSRQPPGHDWRGGRWRSPGSCKRLLRMPGSTTSRGRHASCDIDARRVAFCGTENIGTPNLSYAAPYLACALPCERFASALADKPRITRGRCGSLPLHRDGLPPSTFCRSPGAPVHLIKLSYGLDRTNPAPTSLPTAP